MKTNNKSTDVYLVGLTETSLFYVLWQAMKGKNVGILYADSRFYLARPLLQRVMAWLEGIGVVKSLEAFIPDLKEHLTIGFIRSVYFEHKSIVPYAMRHFKFTSIPQSLKDYAAAYKHVCSSYLLAMAGSVMAVNWAATKTDNRVRVHGVDGEFRGLYANEFGADGAPKIAERATWARKYFNTLSFGILFVVNLARLLARVSLRLATGDQALVNSIAFPNEPTLFVGWSEILDDPQDLLVFFRDQKHFERGGHALNAGNRHAFFSSVKIPLNDMPGLLRIYFRDTLRLAWFCRNLPEWAFWKVVSLPYKRVFYRAVYKQFSFENYYTYDEYSEEHLIRTQELRRAGVTTMGQVHGVTSTQFTDGFTSYLDFDILYVMSKIHFEGRYGETFPPHMKIRVAPTPYKVPGNSNIAEKRTSPDIAIFLNNAMRAPSTVALIRHLAQEFPERSIYVKVKPRELFTRACETIRHQTEGYLPNIVYPDETSYEVMDKISYCFSDTSTITLEAVQMGLICFAMDFAPNLPHFEYRLYPDFCIQTSEQAVARIREIENGKWIYPRRAYLELMALDGATRAEVIREDLGLENRVVQTLAS